MSGPDTDVDQILANAGHHRATDYPWVRELLISAWQFGYTTGMADAAKFETVLANAHHVITVEGPIAYPGGKDGMFLARCICGEWASAIDTETEVRKAGAAHVRDKR